MSNNDSLKLIAARLFKENICSTPLDHSSLETVYLYMEHYISSSDLCRRLSDVELNYVQISAEANNSCVAVTDIKLSVADSCRRLTNLWQHNGYLKDYFFASSENDIDQIRETYVITLEYLRKQLNLLSNALLTISETSAQTRACAASFTEIYKESKLAIYAAMLNRDVADVLECRSTSLQSHASAKECERFSSKLMGNARACTRIINCINNMIIEANQALRIDSPELKAMPVKANAVICSAIATLENIHIEISD